MIYIPITTEHEEYKTVWEYYSNIFKTDKSRRLYPAIKQMIVYDLANRWGIRPAWLTNFKFKHIDFVNGTIKVMHTERKVDEFTLKLLQFAWDNYPSIVEPDSFVCKSQKIGPLTPNALLSVLQSPYEKTGLPFVNRAKDTGAHMSRATVDRRKKSKVTYESWEDVIAVKVKNARTNAKIRENKPNGKFIGKQFDFESQEHMTEWCLDRLKQIDYKCERTGAYLNYKNTPNCVSIDRIDSYLGYTPDNIQFVTKRYNSIKKDTTDEELYSIAFAIVNHNQKHHKPAEQLINRYKNYEKRADLITKTIAKQVEQLSSDMLKDGPCNLRDESILED